MSKLNPTPSQKDAIAYRGGPVLVSAGAGSGKTGVLTERLIRYITEEGAGINEFVVITFTNAAAAELRSRIRTELSEKATENPGDMHLRRQLVALQSAQIGTIHHFCTNILRENAQAVSLSPDFKIISDERASSMRDAALERVLNSRYEHMCDYPGFEELVNSVGTGRTDAKLVELVLKLHAGMQCHPDPKAWADGRVSQLRNGSEDWNAEILLDCEAEASRRSEELDALLTEMAAFPEVKAAYAPAVEDLAAYTREYIRCLHIGWDATHDCAPVPGTRLGTLRGETKDSDLAVKVRDTKKACVKALKELREKTAQTFAQTSEEMARSASSMEALLALTLDFDAEYAKDKRWLNLVDYSDLEHFAAAFLRTHDLSSRWREIMVDEYQDVSRIQDELFRCVSDNGRKLFMVGDIKQSVYRFRLADPEIFKEKQKRRDIRQIPLRENFRSRREIIDCANGIFSALMTEELGGTDYTADRLVFGAGYTGTVPPPEILLVRSQEGEPKLRTEAEAVASEIEKLVASGEVKYGEIAILLRAAGKTGDAFAQALSKRGIPVSSQSGGSFFDAPEVFYLTAWLSILDNPLNDVALITVLTGPALGFTPDDLSTIRAADKDACLFDSLRKAADGDERFRSFVDSYDDLRRQAPDMSVEDILRSVIRLSHLELVCSALPDGGARLQNLNRLIRASVLFEADGYNGVHRFLLYLEKLREKGTDLSSEIDENAAVKIMSMHKSKGLQFKAVFLCNLQRTFNMQDTRDVVLVHPVLGLGPKVTDNVRKIQYPTVARNAISARLKRETLSEEMRLLYVAVTRAEERLFMTGCVDDPEKIPASCPLKWLVDSGAAGIREISVSDGASQPGIATVKEEEPDPALLAALDYAYPFGDAASLPSKVTATELKHYETADEDAAALISSVRSLRRPEFSLESKALSAAERGIATHLCLQYMDFESDVPSEIERLKKARFLSDRQASAVDPAVIERFLLSETGIRIRQSTNVRREFRFSVLCDAEEVFHKAHGEEILLQGVVDCFIEEDGQLVIVDYKTDRVKPGTETEERAKSYAPQLRAYATALGKITGKKVKECVLYFLANGEQKTLAI